MSHTCANILLHLIFSTRERRPIIKLEFRDDLFAYLGGIVRETNGTALIVNGMPDHVHMLGPRSRSQLRVANRIWSVQRQ